LENNSNDFSKVINVLKQQSTLHKNSNMQSLTCRGECMTVADQMQSEQHCCCCTGLGTERALQERDNLKYQSTSGDSIPKAICPINWWQWDRVITLCSIASRVSVGDKKPTIHLSQYWRQECKSNGNGILVQWQQCWQIGLHAQPDNAFGNSIENTKNSVNQNEAVMAMNM